VCALVGVIPLAASAQTIPAFSGADGAAAYASGGRANGLGQIVYHVTKLNSAIDDSARFDLGTLRYGLDNNNFPAGVPRTIVFDVGGVFNLGRLPQTGWDPNGNGWDAQSRLSIGGTNVTFAGQTAPGAGVIFMGGGLKPQGNNNIIRNVTVASGYGTSGWWKPGEAYPDVPTQGDVGVGHFPDLTVFDSMDIAGTNLMIDHVSTLFATDEGISMNEVANNITVQYSNISQGQNYPQWDPDTNPQRYTGHALGSLLSAAALGAISFHHNLYAHEAGRVPQMGVGQAQASGAYYDFRNNVFYNWVGTAGSKSGTTFVNLASNFYLAGNGGDQPVGGTNVGVGTTNGGTGVMSASSSVYRVGNVLDSNKDGSPNNGGALSSGSAGPFWSGGVPTYVGTTDTARVAFDRVLDYMGANWWTRDGVIDTPDERITNEARTGTGKIMAWADDPWNNDPSVGVEWRALKNTPQTDRAADWDTEASIGFGVGDGMPTYWELQHGLDPDARDDAGDFDNDGYTNLEEYLNDVAAWPAAEEEGIVFNNAHGDGRFAHILNWDANSDAVLVHPWQPSRYDTAVIDNGTVAVDAVGQHAGNLLLATGDGDNATLNITSGWIKVEDAPVDTSDGITVIGDHPLATAALNLMGGKLTTKTLLKGDGGTFNFTGGVLSAQTVGFDLVNNGGTIAPGESPGMTRVMGDLVLNSGVLEIEAGGTVMGEYDQLVVDGETTLGGTLKLVPVDLGGGLYEPALGDTFLLLASQNGFGEEMFDDFDLPQLTAGLGWMLSTDAMTLSLSVVEAVALAGDYNNDGIVNAADYTVWRNNFGGTALPFNETASIGTVDEADYQAWKDNFGATLENNGGGSANNAVPEPASGIMLLAAIVITLAMLRRS
jgi:pectate lyase